MIKSLWIKFLLLLFAVSIIALSAALILRNLMVHDFREFLEGEQEDHVYWVTADMEASYDTEGRWQLDTVRRDVVWAYMLGFETRLLDRKGSIVIDTDHALKSLTYPRKTAHHGIVGSKVSGGNRAVHPLSVIRTGQGNRQVGCPFHYPEA